MKLGESACERGFPRFISKVSMLGCVFAIKYAHFS